MQVSVVTLFVAVLTMLDAVTTEVNQPLVKPPIRIEPMMPSRDDQQTIPCPDGGSCDSNTTCCLMSTGKFGCCSKTDGNCCSDYHHCCDSGYVCDMANSKCLKVPITEEDVLEIMKSV